MRAADHATPAAYLRHRIEMAQIRLTAANLVRQSLDDLRDDARRHGDEIGAAYWRRRSQRVAAAQERAAREWDRLWSMRVCNPDTPCRDHECPTCAAADASDDEREAGAMLAGGETC